MTDPQKLVAALEERGWTVAGRGRGYVRLSWPDGRAGSLVVLLDPSAPEFDQHMEAVRTELEDAVATGVQAAYVLAGLVTVPSGKGDKRL